jgi:hypothetical protein
MGARQLFAASCILCVAFAAAGQEIEDVQFFPGVARLAGEPPSQWVSDVAVANLNEFDITVGLLFLRERRAHGVDDITIPPAYRFQLGPRETRVFEDVLRTVFGIDSDTKGGLLVTSSDELMGTSNGEDTRILATMRTYDVSSPVGTYGQTIPATNFVVNSSGWASFVTGARNDARFRSNLGLVNLSLEQVTIGFQIRRSDGTVVAGGTRSLESLSLNQWTFARLGVGTVEGPLTVDLWLDSYDGRDPCLDMFDGGTAFMAYVSKVDSSTQDAEFMYAAPTWLSEIECD